MSEEQKDAIAKQIVEVLKAGKTIESTTIFAGQNAHDHLVVVGIVKSLDAKEVAKITQKEFTETTLTAAGKEAVEKGSPEARLWKALGDAKVAQADCPALIGVDAETGKLAVANGLKLGYFAMEKNPGPVVVKKATSIEDSTKALIEAIVAGSVSDKKVIDPIKKRGFVDIKCVLSVFSTSHCTFLPLITFHPPPIRS